MNREMELKLQAYLDGELSGREARRVAAWLDENSEAQALAAELKATKAVLKENEPAMAVPESREFYWSKIERAIQHQQKKTVTTRGWEILFAWRKYLAPVAGMAMVIFLALSTIQYNANEEPESLRHLAEIENLSEHTGSFSFRSQKENVLVVWVYEKPQSAEPESESVGDDDVIVE